MSALTESTPEHLARRWNPRSPWEQTPLGAPVLWPELLVSTLNVMVASSRPMFLIWGESQFFLPNNAFAEAFEIPMTAQPFAFVSESCSGEKGADVREAIDAWQTRFNRTIILNDVGSGAERGILGIALAQEMTNPPIEDFYMAAPMGMALLMGPSHNVAYANRSLAKLLNQTVEALQNQPISALLPEGVIREFEAVIARVTRTGKRFIARDIPFADPAHPQKKVYFKFHFEPYTDASGRVVGTLVIADDTTASVLSRQKIRDSETAHKLAIEAARMGSFEFHIDTKAFTYSERFARIFGRKSTDLHLPQEAFVAQILPEDANIRLLAHQKMPRTRKLFYEVRIQWPNKEIHWIRIDGKLVSDPQGKPHKIFGTLLDVTEQKTYEQTLERRVALRTERLVQKNNELRASEERFQRMTEEVQDYAILLLDKSGHILNWNKGAQQIKGYEESEIIGKHISIFYMEQDRRANLPATLVAKAEKEGRAVHEGYRVRKDGTLFWGSVAMTALHDSHGAVIGFSKVTRDLTERKRAEDQLKEYTAELEFQNRELEQFAYIASHDLQEPLRKIQMFSGLVSQHLEDKAAVEKYFSKIVSSAARMSELIRSVLHYSRLSKVEEPREMVDINDILADVLVDFELLIEERGAVVKSDALPQIPGIGLQLSQLFSNLIGNALKFTTDKPCIEIRSREVAPDEKPFGHHLLRGVRYCEIVVSDNGIGFDQKYAGQIFTIFQRLNPESSFTGTGIGLALCKKIVGNHKGFISAESTPGKGASFFIYLPMRPNPLV